MRKRRPFEIFINSKNLDHYQWIVALTRIMSAVFRKGGDVAFLVDELKAVFDPRGGYWQPGGKFMPSIIAELGYIVEKHLITIGLLVEPGLDEGQQELIARKRAEYEEGYEAAGCVLRRATIRKVRTAVRQVQHGSGHHDGWLHDLSVLRRLQVRVVNQTRLVAASPVRILYSLLTYLLQIPVAAYWLFRADRQSNTIDAGFGQRFGLRLSGTGRLHMDSRCFGWRSAGRGAVDPRRLRDASPGHELLITTVTPTGAERVRALFGDSVVHSRISRSKCPRP